MKITKESLIEKVKSYNSDLDVDLLSEACDFSRLSHGEQKRASGDPYYYHPLEVADILADLKMDQASIITALLHDTVEDTDVTLKDIEDRFGLEISILVDGVTKLAKIEYQSESTRQAENFRKLLVAISEDIRVLLVKLGDRLHNMRTLHFIKSPAKRTRIAHETMEIYSSLAERIGMQQIKTEMQDLAFAELHPEARDSIMSRLEYLRLKGEDLIESIVEEITSLLRIEGIESEIYGREKTPCSIWRKMERKNISFEQLSDIMAFRIITDDLPSCYQALGIVHTHYKVVPESFRDFISTPKENGYQSLHTIVMGPEQRFIEVQIRSRQMHDVAEFGVAAHWSYKQHSDYNTDGKQYKWVRELLYILEHAADSEEFLENTKLEMYYDQVFSFTPRGELIALPRGATPVDFAYEVHSNVGNHCTGAKVNGKIVPLRTQLENGDQVEIITSKTQDPSPLWENFVVTGKAKSEVRRFIRTQKREEHVKLGKSLLLKEFKKYSRTKVTAKILQSTMQKFGKKTPDDLYAAMGEGILTTMEVIKAIFPNKKIKTKVKNPFALLSFGKVKQSDDAIPIKGLVPGMAVYLAECCHPIPGDSIVGVVTAGKGVTIHTSDCETLSNFTNTPERLVDISWGKDSSERSYIGRVKVILAHEAGSLAALAHVISQNDGNINNLRIINRSTEFFEMIVDVRVKGAKHLTNVITSLRSNPLIHTTERVKN